MLNPGSCYSNQHSKSVSRIHSEQALEAPSPLPDSFTIRTSNLKTPKRRPWLGLRMIAIVDLYMQLPERDISTSSLLFASSSPVRRQAFQYSRVMSQEHALRVFSSMSGLLKPDQIPFRSMQGFFKRYVWPNRRTRRFRASGRQSRHQQRSIFF